jgi:hypothetical protein
MSTPAGTREWRWVPVRHQEDPADDTSWAEYDGAVEYAVYRDGQEPGEYVPAVVRDSKPGIVISDLPAGTYRVRARVTGAGGGDQPLIDCGTFTLT